MNNTAPDRGDTKGRFSRSRSKLCFFRDYLIVNINIFFLIIQMRLVYDITFLDARDLCATQFLNIKAPFMFTGLM